MGEQAWIFQDVGGRLRSVAEDLPWIYQEAALAARLTIAWLTLDLNTKVE